ncbi:MAG: response regulator [Alphaproteobacteria bacterium]|jgi:two-component system, chemotaxis family, chemotaxis protein CheY|nr:response regulator [Alphaproteobacteria bacterium]
MRLQATLRAEESVVEDVQEVVQENVPEEKASKPKAKPSLGRFKKISDKHYEHLARLTYLVVDDSGFNRKIIREALSLFGVRRILEAKDGIEALEMLSKDKVDLVLTDYEMPLVSGIDLTRMVRKSKEVKDPDVPIIIISGYSEEYRLREAIAAGIQEYVTKPFAPDRLLCYVVRALGVTHPALLAAS